MPRQVEKSTLNKTVDPERLIFDPLTRRYWWEEPKLVDYVMSHNIKEKESTEVDRTDTAKPSNSHTPRVPRQTELLLPHRRHIK